MALEELKAQIALLVNQINNQPEDLHELYELIHQKLNESEAWASRSGLWRSGVTSSGRMLDRVFHSANADKAEA